jgi:prolyl-tRNA synthetase
MTHGDDMGLVLPPKVAPIQVVIIPIYYSKEDREKMLLKAKQIADNISSIGIRVHLDDRDQLTPGFKFHDWELKGIPIRIEIGPKDVAKNQVVLARRYNQTKTNIASDDKMSNIAPTVQKELDDIQKQMFVAAEKILDDRIVKVSQFDQFKEELDNGKMLDCSWCGKQECEDKIKEETGADIRVITSNEQKSGICVYCKKTGVSTVLFARGY